MIRLRVRSALDAVGLTAAVATELAAAGMGCNVVAGTTTTTASTLRGGVEAVGAVLRSKPTSKRETPVNRPTWQQLPVRPSHQRS